MKKEILLALCCTGLLSAPAMAGEEAKTRSCCAKAKPATDKTATKLRCSLTGKVVDKCCCIEREGKMHCTLAKKNVEKCCCNPVESDGATATK